jgi:hypothetical protein
MGPRIAPGTPDDEEALRRGPTVFEPLHDATLYQSHNEISFYAWGDRRCCLPRGATSATLTPHLAALAVGDVLLFEEVLGPATGEPGDADPAHRHVVRLTSVRKFSPTIRRRRLTTRSPAPRSPRSPGRPRTPCPSRSVSPPSPTATWRGLSRQCEVARGNMVLADHGLTSAADEALGSVPRRCSLIRRRATPTICAGREPVLLPPRFSPQLANAPLTFAGTVLKTTLVAGASTTQRLSFDPDAPAAAALVWRMEDTLPASSW